MEQKQLAAELAAVAKTLTMIAERLSGDIADEPVFPEKAVRLFAAGICLKCGRSRDSLPAGQKFRRGNCPSCSNAINARKRLEKDPGLEHTLISEGLIAPVGYQAEPDPLESIVRKTKKTYAQVVSEAVANNPDPEKPLKKMPKRKKEK